MFPVSVHPYHIELTYKARAWFPVRAHPYHMPVEIDLKFSYSIYISVHLGE